MILSGNSIYQQKIVTNLINKELQIQPSGLDLTVKKISKFENNLVIDFDNTNRKISSYEEMEFNDDIIFIEKGVYMVEYNENINLPNDIASTLYPRSSLVRSGLNIKSGFIESGYEGPLSSILQVLNPHGAKIYLNARIALCICMQMNEKVEGYSGIYQKKPL